MLKEFGIKNFKGFENPAELKLAPLTLIYGPNSAGKSSIIHALMLLQQSLAKPTKTTGLLSNGDIIDLGSYLTMVNKHNTELNIEFRIKYEPIKHKSDAIDELQSSFGSKNDREHTFVYSFYKNDDQNKSFSYLNRVDFQVKNSDPKKMGENLIELSFTSRLSGKNNYNLQDALQACQKFTYSSKEFSQLHANYIFKKISFISQASEREKFNKRIFDFISVSDFRRDPTSSTPSTINYEISRKNNGSELMLAELEAGRTVNDLSREVKSKLNSISYLGPLRSYPSRVYNITEDYKNSVGKLGENIATFLYLDQEGDLLHKINDTFLNFNIPYKISMENLGNNEISGSVVSIKLFDTRSKVMVAPSDVGFGIGQILPILVEGWTKKDSIICVEQPEIHLHPRLQAELAEYFCNTTKENNNQWIIETHSEALMLRLQKLVRKGEISSDLISVLYVDSDNEGTYVTQIKLDARGDFMDLWPDGFFEERMDELFGE